MSDESKIVAPHGDFRVVKVGENAPHDIGCNCAACVQRRRDQARQPEFAAIVERAAAKLPPPQAQALREAFYGKR